MASLLRIGHALSRLNKGIASLSFFARRCQVGLHHSMADRERERAQPCDGDHARRVTAKKGGERWTFVCANTSCAACNCTSVCVRVFSRVMASVLPSLFLLQCRRVTRLHVEFGGRPEGGHSE